MNCHLVCRHKEAIESRIKLGKCLIVNKCLFHRIILPMLVSRLARLSQHLRLEQQLGLRSSNRTFFNLPFAMITETL
jgi:hypothetical protein